MPWKKRQLQKKKERKENDFTHFCMEGGGENLPIFEFQMLAAMQVKCP